MKENKWKWFDDKTVGLYFLEIVTGKVGEFLIHSQCQFLPCTLKNDNDPSPSPPGVTWGFHEIRVFISCAHGSTHLRAVTLEPGIVVPAFNLSTQKAEAGGP
jgi:hypothetical protein